MDGRIIAIEENFVQSLEFIHPKEIVELLKSEDRPKTGTYWILKNEIRPSDLYCYFGARFGRPNGIQNFLRRDDSDNLIHWEWFLKAGDGYISILGMSFRTEVWVHGRKFPDHSKNELVAQLKADFARHGKAMAEVRKSLEPWIEFVNPYQRLRRAVDQLLKELDQLQIDPETDAVPNILEGGPFSEIDERTKVWEQRAAAYSKATGIAFGLRSMIPVMAEAAINLLVFILAHESIRKTKSFTPTFFGSPSQLVFVRCPIFATDSPSH